MYMCKFIQKTGCQTFTSTTQIVIEKNLQIDWVIRPKKWVCV